MVNVTLLKSTRVPRGAVVAADFTRLAAYVLLRERVRGDSEISVEIMGHKRIHELNRRFRGVDRTTDVISFRNEAPPHLQGDLGINVAQAAIQARKMRHPLKREMRLLLIHGILHLLGYTDYEPRPRRKMFKRQNAILRLWEAKHR